MPRGVLWLTLSAVFLALGAYILLLVTAPVIYSPPPQTAWSKPWPKPQTELPEQRVYIPRLALDLPYKSGDQRALNDALWYRFPERGDPEKGGNFILAGHRFEIGFTPGETRRKSPLYHLDKLQTGDYIYADFNGRRYQYEVTRRYAVKPNQTDIESPSATPKMTLYTCTLEGQADGRDIVEAKLLKKDVNPDEKLALSKTAQ